MEAIDKEKVIAEIKELYNDIDKCISDLIAARGNHDGNGISNAHWRMETLMVNTQQAICNVIDTFETKEVDFEKEWKEYFKYRGDMATVNIIHLAKHFFNLGLMQGKGSDMETRIKKPYYMDACNAIKTNVQLDLFNAERKYYQKEVDYEQMEEIQG